MPKNREQIWKNNVAFYSDEALREIVYESPNQYEKLMVSIATDELNRRCDTFSDITKDEYIDTTDVLNDDTIEESLDELIEEEFINEDNFISYGIINRIESKKAEDDYKENAPRPWVRYFARMTDYIIVTVLINLIFNNIIPDLHNSIHFIRYISLSMIAWVLVESVLMCTVGTTPGKWILKTKVRNHNNIKLGFKESIERAFLVFSLGCCFGVSFLDSIAMFISRHRLIKLGITQWDDRLNLHITHQKIGFIRILFFITIWIISILTIYINA